MESETKIYKELMGKTFTKVERTDKHEHEHELRFLGEKSYKFFHWQDCCEDVSLDDICGDLSDLEDSPITQAEETTKESEAEYGSETWTFYRFATAKGSVQVKWHGSSNGYYSESVDFIEIKNEQ